MFKSKIVSKKSKYKSDSFSIKKPFYFFRSPNGENIVVTNLIKSEIHNGNHNIISFNQKQIIKANNKFYFQVNWTLRSITLSTNKCIFLFKNCLYTLNLKTKNKEKIKIPYQKPIAIFCSSDCSNVIILFNDPEVLEKSFWSIHTKERYIFSIINMKSKKHFDIDNSYTSYIPHITWEPNSNKNNLIFFNQKYFCEIDNNKFIFQKIPKKFYKEYKNPFSPDNKHIAYFKNEEIKIFNIKNRKEIFSFKNIYLPDNDLLVMLNLEKKEILKPLNVKSYIIKYLKKFSEFPTQFIVDINLFWTFNNNFFNLHYYYYDRFIPKIVQSNIGILNVFGDHPYHETSSMIITKFNPFKKILLIESYLSFARNKYYYDILNTINNYLEFDPIIQKHKIPIIQIDWLDNCKKFICLFHLGNLDYKFKKLSPEDLYKNSIMVNLD